MGIHAATEAEVAFDGVVVEEDDVLHGRRPGRR
jgi:alkylation response protein AidB-like acyl-CoA dehydrogenase